MQSTGNASNPAYSTSTYPATNAVNTLLYASSANTMAALATANSGTLITSAGGVPSISSTLPSAVQGNITTVGTITSGTWTGTSIALANGGTSAALTASNGGIFYSTASAGAILSGTATANQVLHSGASTTPVWSTSTYPLTNAVNTLLYASSANVMAALATANNGTLITSSGGVPSISSTLPSAVQGNITSVGALASGSLTTGFTAINVAQGGTGAVTLTGVLIGNGTSAFTASTITQYDVLVGGASNAISSIGPGTSGQLLTSAGNAANPAYKSLSINCQVFTTTGTYTPTAGMQYCVIECIGGGGGGGGCAHTVGNNNSAGGGGSGGYCSAIYTAAQIGASKAVTIGAGGTAGAVGNNTGGTGGTTTVGATLLSSLGGVGGVGGAGNVGVALPTAGGAGGTASITSGITIVAQTGYSGFAGQNGGGVFYVISGKGADSRYGAGGSGLNVIDGTGNAGIGYGAGGSGGAANAADKAGGAGSTGAVIIKEYVIS